MTFVAHLRFQPDLLQGEILSYQALSPSMVVQALWATPWKLKGKMHGRWAWGPSTVSQCSPVESFAKVQMNQTKKGVVPSQRLNMNIPTTRKYLFVARSKAEETISFPTIQRRPQSKFPVPWLLQSYQSDLIKLSILCLPVKTTVHLTAHISSVLRTSFISRISRQ